MFIGIVVCALLGISLGIATGIVPGLHPNTILLIFSTVLLAAALPAECTLSLVASLAVTNSIVNFIPTVFTGAPEPDNCLSVLPAHRFLLAGRGYEALYLSVTGGMMVLFLTLVSVPFLLWFVPRLYATVSGYIHVLLIAVLVVLLSGEEGRKRILSLFFFCVSGLAGLMLLSSLPSQTVLFPSLTGLFGISILAFGASSVSIPYQRKTVHCGIRGKGGLGGWLAGMFVGMLPGIGSAQAGVLANTLVRGDRRDFMTALGGINTANVLFSFIMLYSIMKTRTGAALYISDMLGRIDAGALFVLFSVSAFSCLTASAVTLWMGRKVAGIIAKADYRNMNFTIIAVLFILALAFNGTTGLIIAVLCSVIGIACGLCGIKRMYLMGFLMLPTILYFSGFTGNALSLLLL